MDFSLSTTYIVLRTIVFRLEIALLKEDCSIRRMAHLHRIMRMYCPEITPICGAAFRPFFVVMIPPTPHAVPINRSGSMWR